MTPFDRFTILGPTAPPSCDFCYRRAHWRFPARNFPIMSVGGPEGVETHISGGAWAACDTCRVLILADNHDALLRRSMDENATGPLGADLPPEEALSLRDALRRLHEAFFANREGPPEALDYHPGYDGL